ncbi:hypothetical protein A2U01_0007018 [Trifolium medium]|uniref:Uncharacterized protein n=1 Tax=Trifolium medium TaxID=97028 RepID=A0A392MIU6_9FABA|nr:hypothetical protein [Trifolium medium]
MSENPSVLENPNPTENHPVTASQNTSMETKATVNATTTPNVTAPPTVSATDPSITTPLIDHGANAAGGGDDEIVEIDEGVNAAGYGGKGDQGVRIFNVVMNLFFGNLGNIGWDNLTWGGVAFLCLRLAFYGVRTLYEWFFHVISQWWWWI